MRAFILNKDTVDLVVSAGIIGRRPDDQSPETSKRLASTADAVGQSLWDENYAALRSVYGTEDQAPSYKWLPVLDLMDFTITDNQCLQIERSRRCLTELSENSPQWQGSLAQRFLGDLGDAIKARLGESTLEGLERATADFEGMENTSEIWHRSIGLKPAIDHRNGSKK